MSIPFSLFLVLASKKVLDKIKISVTMDQTSCHSSSTKGENGMALDTHPNFLAIETERIAIFARLNLAMADITGRRGRYAQLLASPAQSLDGTSRAAFTTRQVADEVEPWPNLSAETASGVRGQYFTHRHDHPDGSHEYTLGCRVVWNGVEYLYEARNGTGGRWFEVVVD